MRALLSENPEYRAVTVMVADWDTHRRSPIIRELKVPRRSTLVMFKDGKEIDRVLADPRRKRIDAMFKAAL